MIFGKNTTQYASFEKVYDADGRVWIYAVAHGSLTAKTPYQIYINEYGPVTAALVDAINYAYIGIPAETASTGDIVKLQIGGVCEDMISGSLTVAAGNAFSILNGAVADSGADFTGLGGQFAACITPATASTTHDVMLIPERIIGTT